MRTREEAVGFIASKVDAVRIDNKSKGGDNGKHKNHAINNRWKNWWRDYMAGTTFLILISSWIIYKLIIHFGR